MINLTMGQFQRIFPFNFIKKIVSFQIPRVLPFRVRSSKTRTQSRYIISRKWASREVRGEFLWIYGTPNQFEKFD